MSDWNYGVIPEGWECKEIGEYCNVITDYVANGSFAALAENVKYKASPDMAVLIRLVDYNNGFKGDFVYIDEHAYNFLRKSKLLGGEIIISNVGANVGTVFKCPNLRLKMSLAPNAIMLRTKGIDDFFYYWFRSPFGQHSLRSIVTGSAQPKFNKTTFRKVCIPVPPIEIQKKIAGFFKMLDDKIEVNQHINDNLEQQAQALFVEMFPDIFSDETGQTLESLISFSNGKKRPVADGKIPVYGGHGILAYTDKSNAQNCVVIGRVGAYCGNTYLCTSKCWVSDNAIQASSKQSKSQLFIYYLLKNAELTSRHIGTGQPLITQVILNAISCKVPDMTKIRDFISLCTPLQNAIDINVTENIILASTRDTLLPNLISGELDVSEVVI